MTTDFTGMSPAQYITALNNNFAELATNWGVNQTSEAKSFDVLITSNATPSILNKNFRGGRINYGVKSSAYLSALNLGFLSSVKRFQDDFAGDIIPSLSAYGEPSLS